MHAFKYIIECFPMLLYIIRKSRSFLITCFGVSTYLAKCQKVDFGKVFPPFWGFSTKKLLVTRGFCFSRFFLSPKIREKQGPPVFLSVKFFTLERFRDFVYNFFRFAIDVTELRVCQTNQGNVMLNDF